MEQLRQIDTSKLTQYMNAQYLNPLKCDLAFLKCNNVVYFMIGMIVLFLAVILFTAHKYSNISLFIVTVCLGIIFVVASIVLIHFCYEKSPSMYSYITLGIAILLTLVIVSFFKK